MTKEFFKTFFLSFFVTLIVIVTVHNINEINASLDRCEEYVAQIEAARVYYEQNFANKNF